MQQAQMLANEESEMAAQQEIDDDNSPMIHVVEVDYASHARENVEKLRSQGEEAILMSEVSNLIPCREGESAADYAKRYSDGINDMIRRGVSILSDQITHDVSPSMFHIDGHDFDVGPESGITKKEYREFGDLLGDESLSYADIPERFKKFEVARPHSEV